jgi:hypothetical protein
MSDMDHVTVFIFRLGFVTGALSHPAVVAYLKSIGASEQKIEAARVALRNLVERK